jgi:hypothetical protein
MNQSLVSEDERGVSPLANKKLKTLLTMAAICADRFDSGLKAKYHQKVGEGKPKMSVLNTVPWASSLRRNPFIVHLREQQPFLRSVMISSNELLRCRLLFTIIYKVYILIYHPDPSS